MSGHSKWSTIKHKKGAQDKKRGKVFTKIIREITVAAREGSGDPDTNPRLRLAVQKAKDANMPSDNIDRAIKKGTGELEGQSYESVSFEGYAPGGVAVIVEGLSDNKNRITSEVRSIFTKRGGSLAAPGAVSFQFDRKGLFMVERSSVAEEELLETALSCGAEDMTSDEEFYQVTCDPQQFDKVRSALESGGIKLVSSDLAMIPRSEIKVEDIDTARKVLSMVEDLEENDDVQNIYSNFDIPEEVLSKLEKENG